MKLERAVEIMNVQIKCAFLFLISSIAFFAGCRRRSEANTLKTWGEVVVAKTNVLASALSDSDTLVSVNGKHLTKGDLMSSVRVRRTLYKIQGRQVPTEKVLAEQIGQGVMNQWINQQVLLDYIRERKIKPDEKIVKKMEEFRLKKFGEKYSSEDEMKKILKKDFPLYQQQLRDEALVNTFFDREFMVVVTDEEISRGLSNVKAYNDMVSATNALVKAKGRQIYEQLKKGENFGRLSDEFSDDPGKEENGEWGWFVLEKITGEELRSCIKGLAPNQYSEPLDTDYGLMIVKLLETRQRDDGETEYHLGRILLRLGESSPVPTKEEEARRIRARKGRSLQKEFIDKLRAGAAISYPHGTNLFRRVQNKK